VLLTTGTSWLVTTVWVVWGTGVGAGVDGAALMRGLALVLVVPVGLGQLLRASDPVRRLAARGRRLFGVLSQLLIFALILQAVVEVSRRLDETASGLTFGALALTAVVCVATHLAALAAGLVSSRGLGFPRPSRIAVAFAGSQKTLPVALFLFHGYFKHDYPLAVIPLAFYHVGQLVADTFIADGFAGRQQATAKLSVKTAPRE
jgi:sodium/bile acid cotransporter 7